MKKRVKSKHIEIGLKKELFILALVGLFISLFFFIKPSYIGFVIYSPSSYNWTFDNPDDYNYDNSLINISNGEVTLIPTIITEFWTTTNEIGYEIQQAVYNDEDKTDKVSVFNDNKKHKVKEDSVFNIYFNDYLSNGDIINLYLKEGKDSDIYLCDISIPCNSPGYGLVHYSKNQEGWYNININNLPNNYNSLLIKVQDEVAFDYINATHFETIENNSTNTSYPGSAVIETKDINIISSYLIFNSYYEGNIIYKYSTDSGVNWLDITDNNISFINKTAVRFNANLTGDTLTTPRLYDISIDYLSEICEESWSCDEWSECSQETKLVTRICNDISSCGTTINKPLESSGCFPDYYEINNSQVISVEANKLTKINTTDIILDILTNDNISDANISVVSYENHESNLPSKSLKFVDINANPNLIQSLSSTSIKIYYTDEEINRLNLKEDSLKIYYYNESSSIWEALDSSINTEDNYIEINLTHFSTYGVFGNEIENNPPTSSSGSASSSSSGGRKTTKNEVNNFESQENLRVEEKKEEITETKPEEPKEEVIDIKEKPNNIVTGEIIREIDNSNIRTVITGIILLAIIAVFAFIKINFSPRSKS
ncbi:hypothetical protein HYX17_04660 [Candidatus Woesearchaeota archaeon]|nr:hypothetical protein [Candidatus Woesearchaeota archaeon]